jgi:hypothetical protein
VTNETTIGDSADSTDDVTPGFDVSVAVLALLAFVSVARRHG